MRNLKLYLLLAIGILATGLFTSCNNDDEETVTVRALTDSENN